MFVSNKKSLPLTYQTAARHYKLKSKDHGTLQRKTFSPRNH